MFYPKIKTLFKRDPHPKRHHVMEGVYSEQEFKAINYWSVTEKIDGMNIRVVWDGESVIFGGRTDRAQLPAKLVEYLTKTFTKEKLTEIFPDADSESVCTLFGEGYGAGIQKGGNYRPDQSFILFDVYFGGWWLDFESIIDIADKLGIDHVPHLGYFTTEEIVRLVKSNLTSQLSLKYIKKTHVAEGVVATSVPMMLFRNGRPLRFKLKVKDFGQLGKD